MHQLLVIGQAETSSRNDADVILFGSLQPLHGKCNKKTKCNVVIMHEPNKFKWATVMNEVNKIIMIEQCEVSSRNAVYMLFNWCISAVALKTQ